MSENYKQEKEPLMLRLFEALLDNIIVLVVVVAAIAGLLWHGIMKLFGGR